LAAAAVLVILGIVAALVGPRTSDTDQAAEESGAEERAEPEASADAGNGADDAGSEQSQGGETDGGAASETGTGAEPPTASPGDEALIAVPDLGAVAGAAELRQAVSENLAAGELAASRATASPATSAAGDDQFDSAGCPGLSLTGDPARGTHTFVADAVLDGEPVRVHLYEQDGRRTLVATDGSCTDTASVPYPG
jgi:hypothetical protein